MKVLLQSISRTDIGPEIEQPHTQALSSTLLIEEISWVRGWK
jgi:hypothetical protein